jgi:predicted outer membrane protein
LKLRPIPPGRRDKRRRRRGVVLVVVSGLAMLLFTAGCRLTGTAEGSNEAERGKTNGVGNGGKEPNASTSSAPGQATWKTRWGPLSAADRELIKKVRLASLWEMPMAQEATKRAKTAKVKQISKKIAAQHMFLDKQVRTVAKKLKAPLPTQPNADQMKWMADIRSKRGRAYDVTYVKWLRFAHGQIFGLIGQVRGSTQNTVARRFAEVANKFVLTHQRLLESTGLTESNSFPPPPKVS